MALGISLTGSAQFDEIVKIRGIYKDVKAAIEENKGVADACELEFGRMIPALGYCKTNITFYGNELFSDEEAHKRWDLDGELGLNLVIVSYNLAARQVYIEYLFHPASKQLIFYYKKDDLQNKESRYYFSGSIIKVKIDYTDPDEKEMSYVQEDDFTVENMKHAEEIQLRAAEYYNMFTAMNQFEKIEK